MTIATILKLIEVWAYEHRYSLWRREHELDAEVVRDGLVVKLKTFPDPETHARREAFRRYMLADFIYHPRLHNRVDPDLDAVIGGIIDELGVELEGEPVVAAAAEEKEADAEEPAFSPGADPIPGVSGANLSDRHEVIESAQEHLRQGRVEAAQDEARSERLGDDESDGETGGTDAVQGEQIGLGVQGDDSEPPEGPEQEADEQGGGDQAEGRHRAQHGRKRRR